MGLVKRTYVDGETVITADNLNDIQDEIIQNASDISTKGTYSKPSGGIPSTDMTTAVQTSLGKADTAYQKPSGGIPSTDLASAVQTSLGKADTALQSSDIDNTLTVTGKAADAKAAGDAVSELRNTLNNNQDDFNETFGIGKNKANSRLFEDGYLSTQGAVIYHASWKTTNFCDVEGLSDIVLSGKRVSDGTRTALQLYYLCTYDENKEFIAQIYTSTSINTWSVVSGVKYVRVCYEKASYTDIQLESGTTPTSYEPFIYILNTESLPEHARFVSDNFDSILYTIDNTLTNTNLINITSEFNLSAGYIDNSNGNFVAFAEAESTDYLNLYEFRDLYITSRPAYSSNCLYAVYDEVKNYLGYHRKDGLVETDYHVTLADILNDYPKAVFIRFSSITTYQNLVIKRSSNLQEITQIIGKKWAGKKWVCIGDSLTEVNSRTTKHYFEYVADATGISVVNLGSSGRGYKNPSSIDNKTFADVVADVPLDADVVTIFGSGNDLVHGYTLGDVTDTGTTTICGCINTTFDALITRMPTIQLGIVAPTPWESWPPSTADNAMAKYVEALQKICSNRSIPFLDLYHCSNLRPWTAEGRAACYSRDDGNGGHPDENGHKIIAPRFEGFLDFLLV